MFIAHGSFTLIVALANPRRGRQPGEAPAYQLRILYTTFHPKKLYLPAYLRYPLHYQGIKK